MVNDFRSECPYQEIIRLGGELSRICKDNKNQFHESGLIRKHSYAVHLLDLYTHRFLLALHHPFGLKERMDPSLYFSRKVRLEVASSILAQTSVIRDKFYIRVLQMGFGTFGAVPLQAASIICEEILSQLEEEAIMPFNPVSNSVAHNDLYKLLESYTQSLAAGMEHGSMNIEGFLLFCGLLGQIDALKSGSLVDLGITSRVRTSLDECHKALQTRIQSSALDMDVGDITMEDSSLASAISEMNEWLNSEKMVSVAPMLFISLETLC
jgi:hypothetical protein